MYTFIFKCIPYLDLFIVIKFCFLYHRLLVGAPLGQNLQPNTTKSGALWKCSVTSAPTDCIQIITDGKRSK